MVEIVYGLQLKGFVSLPLQLGCSPDAYLRFLDFFVEKASG